VCVCATAVWIAAAEAPRPHAQTTEPRVIEIVARRFVFEPSEIQVGVGERVILRVRSADGPHGIEIRPLKVKREVPRGSDPVSIEFVPREPGRFEIICSEYCGEDHDKMKGVLVVESRDLARR
jgi:cytochrome c oxidase subunit II